MPNLLMLMTPGIGLVTWQRIGTFEREIIPYIEFSRKGWDVKILTFDRNEIPCLPEGIEASRYLNSRVLFLLPLLGRKLGKWADIIKTNQSSNAYFYTRAAKYWKKPILLRCGYVYGEYLETTLGLTPKVKSYQRLEEKAFNEADHCEVTTEALSEWIQRKYSIPKHKISVIPNFVDTDVFKPLKGTKRDERAIISVGRLDAVKQFDLLIKACAQIQGSSLTIVGDGPEKTNLEKLAKEFNVKFKLTGNIPNKDIPNILSQHNLFIITSKREGHPKALIEAMACGCLCIGVDSPGIKNNIIPMKTGLLCSADPEIIAKTVEDLLNNEALQKKLRQNACEFAINNYSFEKIFEKELEIVNKLLHESTFPSYPK